jgi:acetyl coenzyme A synthetase (ADP forming)-like protein
MAFQNPTSIAVIGASTEEQKVGHYVLKNLITQGFAGSIFPVNPKAPEILGKKAYPNVTAIPDAVDMAVIVTPAATVSALAEECGKKGVKTLVVISAGFGEIGTDEGHAREKELVEIVRKYKMQLVGPNCLGMLRPSIGMNVSFADNLPRSGNVALLSQSGAMAVAILDAAESEGLGFSLVVSMGNKAAMDECDFLRIAADDPETKAIGYYLEGIKDGQRFRALAAEVCARKPVVLIKSGVSERGKHAVSSHTGALAGSDAAIDALCAQTGIHRAHTTEQFIDILRAVSSQPPLLSRQIAVITNAGGPGILATDAAEREGLRLVSLTAARQEHLKGVLPAAASAANPIDVLGDALADRYRAALEECVDDAGIDGVVVVLTPQVMTPETAIAQAIIDTMRKHPLLPVCTSFMGDTHVREAQALLHTHGIPNYPTPERAVAALASLLPGPAELGLSGAEGLTMTEELSSRAEPRDDNAQKADALLSSQTGLLSEDLTTSLFTLYGLPLPAGQVAATADEAVTIAQRIGYPVVAKISAPEILHKTDIGAVRANLQDESALRAAFAEILTNAKTHQPDAHVRGVLIQQFLPAGGEFIVGAVRDPSFGPLILAGLGGIYTELFRDTAFRIAPVAEADAYAMLESLKSWKLLLGMRGKAQMDIDGLAAVIVKVSRLMRDCPRIRELDLNPVLVWPDRVTIADAKVVLGD